MTGFYGCHKHGGPLLGFSLPEGPKFWLTEETFIFSMRQDIRTC